MTARAVPISVTCACSMAKARSCRSRSCRARRRFRREARARPLALFPLTVDTTTPRGGRLCRSSCARTRAARWSTFVRATARRSPGSHVEGYLIDARTGPTRRWSRCRCRCRMPDNVNARLRIDASDDLDRWRTVVADRAAAVARLQRPAAYARPHRIRCRCARAICGITWLTRATARADGGRRATSAIASSNRRAACARRPAFREAMADAFSSTCGARCRSDRAHAGAARASTPWRPFLGRATQPQDPWRDVGDTVAYRLRQDGGEVVNAGSCASHRRRCRYFRARLDPKAGGVGKTPPTLVAGWYPQQIVFAARGDGTVRARLRQPSRGAGRAASNARAGLRRGQAAAGQRRRRDARGAALGGQPRGDARAARRQAVAAVGHAGRRVAAARVHGAAIVAARAPGEDARN